MDRRVAIMSDRPVIRAGLRALVAETGARVVAEARVRAPIPDQLRRDACDALVIGVGTAPLAASLAVREAAAREPEAPPLVGVECTGREQLWVFRLIQAGLAAYVSLAAEDASLAGALEAARRGEPLIRLQCRISAQALRRRMATAEKVARLSCFDQRVLQLLNRGLKDREIAKELGCGVSTVKHHVEGLMEESDAANRFRLGVWAHEWALVEGEPGTEGP